MQREIRIFRSWYTLPRARNLKPTFEFQNLLAWSSPSGTLELIPFGANSDLRWNFPAGTSELLPFGANSYLLWDWKFLEIPSRVFLFAFARTSELIPFGINSYLCLNCPASTSALISFWHQLGYPLGFGIPGYSVPGIYRCFPLLGFTMIIPSWGTTYFPVGVLLCFSFLGVLHPSIQQSSDLLSISEKYTQKLLHSILKNSTHFWSVLFKIWSHRSSI